MIPNCKAGIDPWWMDVTRIQRYTYLKGTPFLLFNALVPRRLVLYVRHYGWLGVYFVATPVLRNA